MTLQPMTPNQLARYAAAEGARRDCLQLGREARRQGYPDHAAQYRANAAEWARRRDAAADEQ